MASCNDGDFGTLDSVGANVLVYSDTSLPADTAYTYRVIAFTLSGKPSERDSAPSNEVDATTLPAGSAPNDPSGLVATDFSHDQIDLTWSHVSPPDEDSFEIERCEVNGGCTFSFLTSVPANTLAHSDSAGLSPNTMYRYRLYALNGAGPSSYSNDGEATTQPPPSTPPAAPSNLSASAVSSSQIDLTWVDNSGDEDEFLIERCGELSPCPTFAQIDSVGADITNYSDTGLTALTNYTYRVRASNTAGPSGLSNTDNATTLDDPLPPISFGGTRQLISFVVKRVGPPDALSDGTGVGVGVLDSGCDLAHRDQACTPMVDYHT